MKLQRLLMIGLTIICGGCETVPPQPKLEPDPRVYVTPDAGVFADRILINSGAPIKGSVRIVNPSSVDINIKQTTDWFDSSGQPIATVLSMPQKMTIPRTGDAYIILVAPTPDARQFQIRVEPDPVY